MASGRKSPNMISMTGRRPPTALPKAAPARRELGDRGVEDAVGAVLLDQAAGGGEHAAGHGDVLAEEDDRVVALELLVERLADRRAEVSRLGSAVTLVGA